MAQQPGNAGARVLAQAIHNNLTRALRNQFSAGKWHYNPLTGAMEYSLRPGLNPDPPWRARFNSNPAPSEPIEDGELRWAWTAKTETTSLDEMVYDLNIEFPDTPESVEDNTVELVRDTHVERVYNPEDSEQYVDIEVVDQITFINKYSGAQRVLKFLNRISR